MVFGTSEFERCATNVLNHHRSEEEANTKEMVRPRIVAIDSRDRSGMRVQGETEAVSPCKFWTRTIRPRTYPGPEVFAQLSGLSSRRPLLSSRGTFWLGFG
jgi:hypothetical protein